jgi:hypothetical protein
MPTVIAQDLSNLPLGETALDPVIGEEFTKAWPRTSIAAIAAVAQHRSALAAARAQIRVDDLCNKSVVDRADGG